MVLFFTDFLETLLAAYDFLVTFVFSSDEAVLVVGLDGIFFILLNWGFLSGPAGKAAEPTLEELEFKI